MRRVVVTGMGIVCPLGVGVDYVWERLVAGESGIELIKGLDTSNFSSKIGGQIKNGDTKNGGFNQDDWMNPNEAKRVDNFILYAVAAATQAVNDSGLLNLSQKERDYIGVSIGSGIGGLNKIYQAAELLVKDEYRKTSPFFIPSTIINLAAGHVSIKYGFRGPNISFATACSTGAHSIGESFWLIKNNKANAMIAGGSEASIFDLGMAGFSRMNALASNFNDKPEEASRPWDRDRDGFVMGDGSGVIVLEEMEHAKQRGAKIYAEIIGFGMSGDAHHITAPPSNGEGATLCMQRAIEDANIDYEKINYINAHGTSTLLGDLAETNAIKNVFNKYAYKIPVSSTKSSIGHLLGAAGAVESIFCIKSIISSLVPPTLNLENPGEGCDLDYVPKISRKVNVDYALTNSFGFGGTNAALIFKKF